MGEHTEPIGLGFSVADAEAPDLHLAGQNLMVEFLDWQEQRVSATFRDVIAVRWQEVETAIDSSDRFDATVVVHESEWLAEHARQRIPWDGSNHRHLKLNFNACGTLEVLCTSVEVAP